MRKQRNRLVLLVVILTLGFILSGCASIMQSIMPVRAWTKMPKEEMVTLHYFDNARISKVDGEGKRTGIIEAVYQGKGDATAKKSAKNNPEPALRIPAGERTLSVAWRNNTTWTNENDATFTFVAGRHYRMDVGVDEDFYREQAMQEGMGSTLRSGIRDAFTGDTPITISFEDITNEKGKWNKKR